MALDINDPKVAGMIKNLQGYALANPSRSPNSRELPDRRSYIMVTSNKWAYQGILTVCVHPDFEKPQWLGSICILNKGLTFQKPKKQWGPKDKKRAQELLDKIMSGIGVRGSEESLKSPNMLGVFVECTDEELEVVNA